MSKLSPYDNSLPSGIHPRITRKKYLIETMRTLSAYKNKWFARSVHETCPTVKATRCPHTTPTIKSIPRASSCDILGCVMVIRAFLCAVS